MRNNQQSVNFTGTQNCMYVGTINDLRMFKPLTDGQVVLCSGQTYVADGQGNFYSWSSTATGVDDGVTIILSQYSGQTGRWLILNKQGNIDAVVASLNAEITNRMTADNTLQANINTETSRAEQAEQQLNANKVNRDGDVMYGTLHIQNNAGIQNTSSYTHTSGNIEVSNGLSINANGGNILSVALKQNDSEYYGSLNALGNEYTMGNTGADTEIITNASLTARASGGSSGTNYWTKVGGVLTQSFTTTSSVTNETIVNFPLTFTTIPQVYIQPLRDTNNVGISPMVNEVTLTGFKYHGNDTQVLQVLAVGGA